MSKTIFDDTPPVGTVVTAAFLNALNNHRHTGRDNDGEGASNYALATGSANAYAVTLSPVLDTHIAGMPIVFKANHTNTGAATINLNALGALPIKRPDGADLQADDILSGQIVMVVYDGAAYQLLNASRDVIDMDDFAASLNQNGYQILPSGKIEQWGIYNLSSEQRYCSITFPITFPTACYNLQLTGINPISTGSSPRDQFPEAIAISASGCSVHIERTFNAQGTIAGFFWRALGI